MKKERLICAVIIGYGIGICNAAQFVENPQTHVIMLIIGIGLIMIAWPVDFFLFRSKS